MTEEQLSTIWKNVLGEIELQFSPAVFKTWFKGSHLVHLNPQGAEVSVDNQMAVNFIKKYAEERMVANLCRHTSFPIKEIHYTVHISPKTNKKRHNSPEGPDLFQGNHTVPVVNLESSNEQSPPIASNLNPKYRFETFIVGNRNRLAYAAAKGVANQPGNLYNPLYIYGGVGLGKTHLMQAVGNEIIAREPQKRILYVSCESFMNEFVASLQKGKMDDFKKRYRNIDVFLIDDIQFIAGKEGIQEEFFHTFNALYQTNKQIIITSDKVPAEIKGLEDRLSSRFSSGMIADMQLPDLETRQAILITKCQEQGVSLPDDVILYIADQVETNIRELEGALTTVLLSLQATHEQASIEAVRQALRAFSSLHRPMKKTSFEQISAIVCEFYHVEYSDLQGPRRQAELVKPRQILMYLMKHELAMTFPTIGRQLGGRDHTTAMHSVEKVEKDMKKNPDLLEELQRIKELFYISPKS